MRNLLTRHAVHAWAGVTRSTTLQVVFFLYTYTVRMSSLHLSDAELRRQLTSLGATDVGPITDSTRALYQRRLLKLSGKSSKLSVSRGRRTSGQRRPPQPASGQSSKPAPGQKRPAYESPAKPRNSPKYVDAPSSGGEGSGRPYKRPRPAEPHVYSSSSGAPEYGGSSSGGASGKGMFASPYLIHEMSAKKARIEASFPEHDYSSSSEDDDSRAPGEPVRIYPVLPVEVFEEQQTPPPALPLAPRPLHSPPSPSSSQSLSLSNSFSSDATPQSPEPIDAGGGNGKGIVRFVTNILGAGIKKIVGAASPRSPLVLQRRLKERGSSSSSGIDTSSSQVKEHDSIPIMDVDDNDEPDAEGSVYLIEFPSPNQSNAKPSSSTSPVNDDGSYDWELLPTDVNICKKPDGMLWRLGKGGFGEVFKGLKDGVDEVAVKRVRFLSSSPSMIAQFKQEIDMISRLRHRHILQFYGACIQPTCLYMVTELMQKDLFSALRSDPRYKWDGIYGKEVLEGTAAGLHYLHSRRPPVVHRDIKSPNILLMDGVAKIADVGIARTKAASDMTAQRGFTIAWAAPEVIYRKRATEKIDIWSLGVIIWEVVSGKMPHPGQLTLPPQSAAPLRNLFSSCVHDDPTKRPSAGEVLTELRKIK